MSEITFTPILDKDVVRAAFGGHSPVIRDTDEKEICEAYTSGQLNGVQLAEMHGVSKSVIYRILDKNGISRRPQNRFTGPPVTGKFAKRKENALARQTGNMVTVDAQDTVIDVRPSKATTIDSWEVKFTGSVIVDAESIDQALCEARKLGIVKRVYSVHLKAK